MGHSTLPLLLGAYLTDGVVHTVDIAMQLLVAPALVRSYQRKHRSEALAYLRSVPSDVIFDVVWDELPSYPWSMSAKRVRAGLRQRLLSLLTMIWRKARAASLTSQWPRGHARPAHSRPGPRRRR